MGLVGVRIDTNPNSSHFIDMNELIDMGFAKKNNGGSIKPTLRERVEYELDGYDVGQATV